MNPVFDRQKRTARHLVGEITLIGCHVLRDVVISQFLRQRVNHQRAHFGFTPVREVPQIGNIQFAVRESFLYPDAALQRNGMRLDRRISGRKSDATGFAQTARSPQKMIDERLIEELTNAAAQENVGLQNLVQRIIASPQFREIRGANHE